MLAFVKEFQPVPRQPEPVYAWDAGGQHVDEAIMLGHTAGPGPGRRRAQKLRAAVIGDREQAHVVAGGIGHHQVAAVPGQHHRAL